MLVLRFVFLGRLELKQRKRGDGSPSITENALDVSSAPSLARTMH